MIKRILLPASLAVAVLGAGTAALVSAALDVGVARGYAPEQPIAFSHALHAGDFEIPCLYCHFGAERSRHAGIPPANVCMGCHGELDAKTVELAKLKEAVAQARPVRWVKIHNLPDFAYFNHSQHVALGGVACRECHGPVETMERVRQEAPLTMGWCIDCHKSRGVTELARSAHAGTPVAERPRPIGGMDCSKCHY